MHKEVYYKGEYCVLYIIINVNLVRGSRSTRSTDSSFTLCAYTACSERPSLPSVRPGASLVELPPRRYYYYYDYDYYCTSSRARDNSYRRLVGRSRRRFPACQKLYNDANACRHTILVRDVFDPKNRFGDTYRENERT